MDDDDGLVGGGIFPFLSVLCCTIGAMVLVLVGGTLKSVVKDEKKTNEIEVAKQVKGRLVAKRGKIQRKGKALRDSLTSLDKQEETIAKDIAREEEEARTYVVRLTALGGSTKRAVQAKSQTRQAIARFRRKARETRAIPAKLDDFRRKQDTERLRDREQTRRRQLVAEVALRQQETDKLQAKAAQLERQREELLDKSQTAEVTVTVSGEGSDRTPFYLELLQDKLIVRSSGLSLAEGTPIAKDDAMRPGGLLHQLAAELARPGSNRYALLLVRPGAARLYRIASGVFRRRRAPFTYEPVQASWQIQFAKSAPP